MDERKYCVVMLKGGAWEEAPIKRVYGPYDLRDVADVVADDMERLGHTVQVKTLMCYWRVGQSIM